MNKKGLNIGSITIMMLGVFAMLIGIVLAPPLKEVIDDQRELADCSFANLSLGQSGTCIILDITVPFFIAMVIFGVGLGAIETATRGTR